MSKLTKNQKIAYAKVEAAKAYKLSEAAALLKEITFTKFDSLCNQMVDSIRESSVKMLLTIEIRQAGAAPKREQVAKPTGEGFVPGNGAPGAKGAPHGQPVRVIKIGRNDPCPCGSGLKWKKCTCAKYHPEGTSTNEN